MLSAAVGLNDEADLVQPLLNDVFVNAFADTSRIQEATLAVQMFVQRILLGLESAVVLDREAKRDLVQQWQWTGQYRVWEANRKIFLYPENWVAPELRDDKTFEFREFENTLLQGEVTPSHVDDAFAQYIEGLAKVARLQICGLYLEKRRTGLGSAVVDVQHIFARAEGVPHALYHRTQGGGLNKITSSGSDHAGRLAIAAPRSQVPHRRSVPAVGHQFRADANMASPRPDDCDGHGARG